MSILVTGAGGFVGSALVAALLGQGDRVVALDRVGSPQADHPDLTTVEGDFGDAKVRAHALAQGVRTIVHLATVPGGAAEADPAGAKRINIDAMHDLLTEAARLDAPPPRVVFASSIAVLGESLPASGVDDDTPSAPRLVYGGHKAMMELETAVMSRRGEIDGVSVRLSGIVARPAGAGGMKSAFMSEVFHALHAHRRFTAPVSPTATLWAQSISCCVRNLQHAIAVDPRLLPASRAITLPAIRISMADLVAEIARQTGASTDLVDYAPDAELERAFGAYPPLSTRAAEAAGFLGDGSPDVLVKAALGPIARASPTA